MTGKIYLGGGGNENVAFEVEDNFFKDIKSVLYIPIAWPDNNYDGCLDWFTKMSSSHKKLKIDMLDDASKDVDLSKYESIYIGGGNTFKLLKILKESKLGDKLIDFYKKGGKIFGGSAGAIIWGNTINTALICKDKDENKVGLKDTAGFNQIHDYDIQCHFESDQIIEHQNYIKETKRNILAIPESTALIINNNCGKVIGNQPIKIITNKDVKEFLPNSEMKF